MDFARKQLEKYGWSAGKGLGKHENGISEALKPKLKRTVAGVGHDAASDFTEHWWNDLYNKAAKNLEVENKNGKTKKIKRKDPSEFEITNNTWQIKKRKKGDNSEQEYSNYFVKKAILSNGESKVEILNESESEDEKTTRDVFKMTDEELFAACEGRTAHKGARHGLKALGKLARIEQQERLLLNQDKYIGYSHMKNGKDIGQLEKDNDKVVESNTLESHVDISPVKIKKKKKKHCCEEKVSEDKTQINGKAIAVHAKDDIQIEILKSNKEGLTSEGVDNKVLEVTSKKKRKYLEPNDVQFKEGRKKSEGTSDLSELTIYDLLPEYDNLDSECIKKSKKKKRKKEQ